MVDAAITLLCSITRYLFLIHVQIFHYYDLCRYHYNSIKTDIFCWSKCDSEWSSAIGNCVNESNRTTCYSNDPISTILFDNPRLREIPLLTGLDGDMWASQLLTMEKFSASMIAIDFHFRNNPKFMRVDRVEVVMFNCPQWGIGVESVSV